MAEPMIQRQDLKTQAKQAILAYIGSMDLHMDNKLPREERLCEIIGVSRVTLRSALDELSSEGVVFRRQGRGTFVNRARMEMKVSFNPAGHFSDMIRDSGYTPRIEMMGVDLMPADEPLAAALGVACGEMLVCDKKLFYADDAPCAFCEDYFPRSLLGGSDPHEMMDRPVSVFHYLYACTGRKVCWDKVELSAVDSRAKAELAVFQGQPLLLLTGTDYDEQDKPLVVTKEYVDTRRLSFSQIRRRSIVY